MIMIEQTNFGELLEGWVKAEEWYNSLPTELIDLAETIKKRLKEDKDFHFCISAVEEGSGKSTLALILGFLLDPINFDLRKNVAYIPDYDSIEKQFDTIPRYSLLVIDEGMTTLHKHDWATTGQKGLVKLFVTKRFENKSVAVLMPRLQDLPESIKNHKVKMNAKILKRGKVVLHVRDDSDTNDPWWIEWANKWQQKNWSGKHISDITISDRMRLEKMKRTFIMDADFPPLPTPVEKVYVKLKKEAHNKEEDISETKESKAEMKWKEITFKAIKYLRENDKKINKTKMTEALGITLDTLNKMVLQFDPNETIWGKKKMVEPETSTPDYLLNLLSDLETPSESVPEPEPDL